MSNAVAKVKSAELSTDVLDDIFETAGDGASFDSSEMQIPFVRILQALSPQLNKKKPEFIEGASSSDMYNTVTGQYWDGEEGLVVVPCSSTWSLCLAIKVAGSRVRSLQTIQCYSAPRVRVPKRSCLTAMSWLSLTSTIAWWLTQTVGSNLR
jgi:hypothetical protein